MIATFPSWLHVASVLSLAVAACCAALVAWDETRRRQHMWIMNLVWPLCALFGSVLWLAFYWRDGREMTPQEMQQMKERGVQKDGDTPMPLAVAKGTSHCGAGCTLGDIFAEWLAFAFPSLAFAFGWGSLFGEKTFAVWVLD